MIPRQDEYAVADEELIEGLDLSKLSRFSKLSPALRVRGPQYVKFGQSLPASRRRPGRDEMHLRALRVELRHVRRVHARGSPTVTIQRVVRGYIGRQRAFGVQLERHVYATRIQALGRSFLLRLQLRSELTDLLAAVARDEHLVGELEPHVLLMCADERIRDAAARKIQGAWVPRHTARRHEWGARVIQQHFRKLQLRHEALECFLRTRGMHDLHVVSWARPQVSRAVAKAARLVRDEATNGAAVQSKSNSKTTIRVEFEASSVLADKMPHYLVVPPATRIVETRAVDVPIHFLRSDAVLRRSARNYFPIGSIVGIVVM